jgi:FkbM family methyltransferase
MQLKRAKLWFSRKRLHACRLLFKQPWKSHLALAFLTANPVQVTLKNGASLAFSRAARDHRFWDWFLSQSEATFEFTADGLVRLTTPTHVLLLRPGTSDFFAFREIFLQDCYGLKDLPARLGTVVDLGANVGLFTCAIQARADKVISVEAVESHYRQARANIVLNGGDPTSIVRFAVTGQSGQEVTMHVDHCNAGSSSLYQKFSHDTNVQETVTTIGLADLLASTGGTDVDLLKCDVEGAEFEIFLNTPLSLLRRIRRLVMEVHLTIDDAHKKEQALIGRLREAGMTVSLYTPPGVLLSRMLSAWRIPITPADTIS